MKTAVQEGTKERKKERTLLQLNCLDISKQRNQGNQGKLLSVKAIQRLYRIEKKRKRMSLVKEDEEEEAAQEEEEEGKEEERDFERGREREKERHLVVVRG